jgi:putative ABC transport system permease protein
MRRVFGIQYLRMINAQAKSMPLMDRASKEIEQLLRKRHRIANSAESDFMVRTQAEMMQMANQFATMFTLLLGGIASVSLLVGGIGIMNIMLVSVTERTREIGVRMAVGAKPRNILAQFLVEALALATAGGFIGIVLGVVGGRLLATYLHWPMLMRPDIIAISVLFSALVGVIFGLYPARKASLLDPIDALRFE